MFITVTQYTNGLPLDVNGDHIVKLADDVSPNASGTLVTLAPSTNIRVTEARAALVALLTA